MTRSERLYDLVDRIAKDVSGWEPLADVTGLTLSALLRGAKAGRLKTDTCLTIAEVGGLDPSRVLRAAGKEATAERIERLYGKPREPLSDQERALLALEPEIQRQVLRLVTNIVRLEK